MMPVTYQFAKEQFDRTRKPPRSKKYAENQRPLRRVSESWLMLQQEQPEDFVIATGVQYTVRAFVEEAAKELGIAIRWEGQGVNEVAVVEKIERDRCPALKVGQTVVRIDPRYFRPAEVETLLGDPSLAKKDLGWIPQITLDEMVQEMVAADLGQAQQHALLKHHGYSVPVSKEK